MLASCVNAIFSPCICIYLRTPKYKAAITIKISEAFHGKNIFGLLFEEEENKE